MNFGHCIRSHGCPTDATCVRLNKCMSDAVARDAAALPSVPEGMVYHRLPYARSPVLVSKSTADELRGLELTRQPYQAF